jgi:AraC-like DNA-binding protein
MQASIPVFEHVTNSRRHAALLRWSGWPTKVSQHRHEREAEFGLITAGTGNYTAGDQSFSLLPGRLFYIPPGVPHGSPGVQPSLKCWTLAIPRERLGRTLAATNAASVTMRLPPAHTRRLARMLADLLAEPDDAAFDLGARFVAASALASLSGATSDASARPVHPAVEMATRLLREEREDSPPLTLEVLAKRCGVSRSLLTALFRKHHGMSIVQFRNQERLHRSMALYAAHPERGMTRAAFDAGFGSYSQFYRTFLYVTGCTPAAYVRIVSTHESGP